MATPIGEHAKIKVGAKVHGALTSDVKNRPQKSTVLAGYVIILTTWGSLNCTNASRALQLLFLAFV